MAKKLGGRWGGGKAGSDPSVLLQDPYLVAQRTEGVKGRAKDGAAAVNQLMGGYRLIGPGGSEANGGTLVVCPLSLIGQWRGEIESKTRKGAITVCFHYGSGRNRQVQRATLGVDFIEPILTECCRSQYFFVDRPSKLGK